MHSGLMHPGLDRFPLADYELSRQRGRALLTPALVIYAGIARANARAVIALCGGDPQRWRPHLKTTKSPRVWGWLLDLGVRHFKCATLKEARHWIELCSQRGIDDGDLLVAQPLLGPALTELERLAAAHTALRVSVLCEDAEIARALGPSLGIFVDLNTGLDRTGVPLADFERVRDVARASGPRFRGLHAYEGLVAADPATRSARCRALYAELESLVAALGTSGVAVGELVTSGTPAFLEALAHPGFRPGALGPTQHRVSPGTVVFHDLRSATDVPALLLTPAAVVVARVVSHPRPGRATCDAGSKALAAEVGDPCAAALGWPGLRAATPNEEHLPLDVVRAGAGVPADAALAAELPARGDLVYLVPAHVCPTVNLADAAWLVEEDGSIEPLPIVARGHDLEGLEGPPHGVSR